MLSAASINAVLVSEDAAPHLRFEAMATPGEIKLSRAVLFDWIDAMPGASLLRKPRSGVADVCPTSGQSAPYNQRLSGFCDAMQLWITECGIGCFRYRPKRCSDRAAYAEEPAGSTFGGRTASDLGHPARAEGELPLVRLPCRVWPLDHDLQSLVAPGLLGQAAKRACACGCGDEKHRDRQHVCEGAARGVRRKRGDRRRQSAARAVAGRPRSTGSPTLSAAPMR